MRAGTLEVVWHKKEAIHAFDCALFPNKEVGTLRVASGGVDCMVRIWLIRQDEQGKSSVEHRATLNRHERGVGAVRFCPVMRDNTMYLATAADDSIIIVWKYEAGRTPIQSLGDADDEENSQECWITASTLRGHIEDVSDLSWSRDGSKLASSGIDHSVIIWDVKDGRRIAMCQQHSHYAQGVALDPFGTLVASLSADRSLRFYTECNKKGKDRFKSKATSNKMQFPGYCRPVRIWWDDTLPGFVRRLTWSPDGLFLVAPSGEINPPPQPLKNDENKSDDMKVDLTESEKVTPQKKNCVCMYTRGNLRDPVYMMVTPEPAMVTRWCPKLFKLRGDSKNVSTLDYSMIFAVSTTDSVILFETQSMKPVGRISDIHYANMTDLAWAHDGNTLFVSSRDGYVTRIDFTSGELGEEYERPISEVLDQVLESLNTELDDYSDDENEPELPDRLSPQLEKMKLKGTPLKATDPAQTSPKSSKAKKRVSVTTISPAADQPKVTPEKKPKKKVAITTLSSVPR